MRHPSQPEASPPGNESNDREAQELSKLVGMDGADVAPNFRACPEPGEGSAGVDPSPGSGQALKVSATQTDSPTEENAAETPKSPEQSENVTENNGQAVPPDTGIR
ncbi:hypothetical protein SBA2_730006 [Acidobacteriia bacterium SbA2]|nr:hypothetical protein SBA2_730006 [Acidobacteriia bacterium SbA2]